MPLYTYECGACKSIFDSRHSIKEPLPGCESCGDVSQLRRIPPVPFILKKNENKPAKAGSVVKSFIEEAKQELKREKKELQEREVGEG